MVTNESLKEIIIANFKELQHEAKFLLKAIPKDKLDFSPHKRMKKLGKLARHIAVIPYTATLYAEEFFCEHATPDELNELIQDNFGEDLDNHNYEVVFEKSCEYFLNFYNNQCDDSLVNKTFINPANKEITPYLKNFLNVQNHLSMHVGTLNAYIKEQVLPDAEREYIEKKVLYSL